MASQIVPLTADPRQTFQISLNINATVVRLTLTITYNEMANYWVLKVQDSNGTTLIDSVPMLTGVWPACNFLSQYQYLGIGSAYLINLGNENDYPNAESLGSTFLLLWSDNV